MKPAGLILAGGQATRMGGGDKCMLDIDGRRALDHVMDRLRPQVGQMVLSANGAPDRFAKTGLPVVGDSLTGFLGPLAGILAGLRWAADHGHQDVVSVAADTPFFPVDLVDKLIAARDADGADIALACSADPDGKTIRQPTFGLWPVRLADDLQAFLQAGDRKIILWAQRHKLAAPVVGPTPAFFNINTPDDLDVARKMAGSVA